jgi:hypothetical protein
MAFADVVTDKVGIKAFCLSFSLYNYDTSDELSIQVSSNDQFGPTYQPILLSVSDVSFELGFGQPVTKISDLSFSIANTILQHGRDISHSSVSELFGKGYHWKGRTVLVKLGCLDTDGSVATQTIWSGTLTDGRCDGKAVHFEAVAEPALKMDRVLPPDTILKHTYAGAPAHSIGSPLPIVFGDCGTEPVDSGKSDQYNKDAEMVGLSDLTRVVRCICVDQNIDTNVGPTFMVSGHELKTFPVASSGSVFIHLANLKQMGIIDSSRYSLTNDANGGKIEFTYKNPQFTAHIDTDGAYADTNIVSPENAHDKDAATYCTSDGVDGFWTKTRLSLVTPRPPDLGAIEWAKVYVLCSFNTSAAGHEGEYVRRGLWNVGTSAWQSYTDNFGVKADPPTSWLAHTITGVTSVSDFPAEMAVKIEHIVPGASGTWTGAYLRIYEICLVVKYEPYADVFEEYRERKRGWWEGYKWVTFRRKVGQVEAERFPNITLGEKDIYAACQGMKDDGSGTVTGTANALIETPSSIVHQLVKSSDYMDYSDVQTSAPGSFTEARTDQAALSLKAAMSINEHATYSQLLPELCRQSLLGLMVKPASTMPIGVVFWGSAAADNLYGTAIHFDDVLDGQETATGWTSAADIRNAFYIQCEYCPQTRTCEAMAMCDGTDSDDGLGTDDYAEKAKLATSITRHDRREFHLRADYLRVNAIDEIRNRYADMLYDNRVGLRFPVPWKYYDLMAGHVIEIDNDSWRGAGWYYPAKTNGGEGYWKYDGVTRYFLVERVSFSDDGYMEIEASEGVW